MLLESLRVLFEMPPAHSQTFVLDRSSALHISVPCRSFVNRMHNKVTKSLHISFIMRSTSATLIIFKDARKRLKNESFGPNGPIEITFRYSMAYERDCTILYVNRLRRWKVEF